LIIYQIPSSIAEEEENIIDASYHPSWIIFVRLSSDDNDYLRVITYINIKLISLRFLLRKDIFNYHDTNLISFFNHDIMGFILNVYSDHQQNVLKYLKNTKVNLNNILIMIGDFNMRDS